MSTCLYASEFKHEHPRDMSKIKLASMFAYGPKKEFATFLNDYNWKYKKISAKSEEAVLQEFVNEIWEYEEKQLRIEHTQVFEILGIKGLYSGETFSNTEICQNTVFQEILMFLQSKHDNLLLQLGGLVHAILLCEPDEQIKQRLLPLFGTQETASLLPPTHCRIKCKDDLLESCFEVLTMVPPFRIFTNRLFARIIRTLDPAFELSDPQRSKLQGALNDLTSMLVKLGRKEGVKKLLAFRDKIVAELS